MIIAHSILQSEVVSPSKTAHTLFLNGTFLVAEDFNISFEETPQLLTSARSLIFILHSLASSALNISVTAGS